MVLAFPAFAQGLGADDRGRIGSSSDEFVTHCLTTAAANIGRSDPGAGFFLGLSGTNALAVTSIRCETWSAAGPVTIDIYRRPNSYVGNTGSMADWTLHGTFGGTSDGTVFSVDLQHAPILVPAGGTATMGGG